MWVEGNHCDSFWHGGTDETLVASAKGADLGSFIVAGKQWLNRRAATAYEVRRTERRIRIDGLDFYRFTLLRRGQFRLRQTTSTPVKSAGDLFLFDSAQVNECAVEGDEDLSLVIPRDLLPSSAALLHSETLTGAIAHILADHMSSLFANLSRLRQHEIAHVTHATLRLLIAAVSPTPDFLKEAEVPIRAALLRRVQRYMDVHLLEPDLNPDRICRDVGLSRAKLYQLFEGSGGVMHQIQRRRLRQAYRYLSDPARPRALIAEIAWNHGFPNEKYFHRLFKAEFGHTPHETEKRANCSGLFGSAGLFATTPDGGDSLASWTLPYGVPRN